MADKTVKRVELSTGVGVLSFPRVFPDTAGKNDKQETVYDIQILIPKSQREDCRALLRAIKEVGVAKWGDNWRKVRNPLRDGDKEKDELAEDGQTKGEKYPERLGCYFINARSTKPVGVYDRQRNPIHDSGELYGGCKGKINVTFYPYSSNGNHGIAAGLNGVQKVAEGTPFGGGKPSVESMFDVLDDDEDIDLDEADEFDDLEEDEEPEEKPVRRTAKKTAAKKATAKPAKKAAAKRRKPEPEPEELDDEDIDEDEEDLYDDLDEDI